MPCAASLALFFTRLPEPLVFCFMAWLTESQDVINRAILKYLPVFYVMAVKVLRYFSDSAMTAHVIITFKSLQPQPAPMGAFKVSRISAFSAHKAMSPGCCTVAQSAPPSQTTWKSVLPCNGPNDENPTLPPQTRQ